MERGEPKECESTKGAGEGKRTRREKKERRWSKRQAKGGERHDTTRPGTTEGDLGAPRARHKGLSSAASSPQLNASRPFPILSAPIALTIGHITAIPYHTDWIDHSLYGTCIQAGKKSLLRPRHDNGKCYAMFK